MSGRTAHYFIVRYMFNELGEEATNIGVIVAGAAVKEISCRFLEDLTSKSRADVKIDEAVVRDFRVWLDRELKSLKERYLTGGDWLPELDQKLHERTGNVLRVLGPRPVLASDTETEARVLFEQWVAPRRSPKSLGVRK